MAREKTIPSLSTDTLKGLADKSTLDAKLRSSCSNELKGDPQVLKTEVILGTDAGIREVLDFNFDETGCNLVLHEEGPVTFFVVARTGGKIIASLYVEHYSESDSAVLKSNCPPFCWPYFCRVSSIVGPSKVVYSGFLVVRKEFRGGNVVRMVANEMARWTITHDIRALVASASFTNLVHVHRGLGCHPLGGSHSYSKVFSRDGIPRPGMLVPYIMLSSDHPFIKQLYPRQAVEFQKLFSEDHKKAIQDRFPIYAANLVSTHASAKKLRELISPLGINSTLNSLKEDELAQILTGSVQFDIQAGNAIVPGHDVSQKDWIILSSGEMVVQPASTPDSAGGSAQRITPGQILGGTAFESASRVVVVKDSRFFMLSASGAKRLARFISGKNGKIESQHDASGSYGIHLSDRNIEIEIARLEQQAKLAKMLELDVLKSAGLRNGSFVADVGCGTGAMSIILAQEFPNAKIVGIDSSKSLLSTGRALAHRLGLASRLTFAHNSGDQIKNLQPSTVDFSYARMLMQHVRQPLNIIREMMRIVKPGGKILVMDIDDGFATLYPTLPGVGAMMEEVARVQKERGGDRFVGRKLFHFFKQLGLLDVKTRTISIPSHELPVDAYYNVVFTFRESIFKETGRMDESRCRLFDDIKQHLRKPSTFATSMVFFVEGTVPPLLSSRL